MSKKSPEYNVEPCYLIFLFMRRHLQRGTVSSRFWMSRFSAMKYTAIVIGGAGVIVAIMTVASHQSS